MVKNDESNSEQEGQKEERKFNQEHYDMLVRCSKKKNMAEWNEWVKKNLICDIRLEGANLQGVDLRDADLEGARLDGARLFRANLRGANLTGASLKRADLRDARLDITYCFNANIESANLEGAKLRGAKLQEANLTGANLDDTDFEAADLHGCRGIVFNSTYIRNARHLPANQWHRLRNKYTGVNLAFHIILLVAFVLIYSVKAMFWYGLHKGQTVIIGELASLESFSEEKLTSRESDQSVAQESQTYRELAADISKICTNLQQKIVGRYRDARVAAGDRLKSVKVWQILLSQDKGLWFQFTAIVLIIYNLSRYILTRLVAPLSAEEDRTHYTPSSLYYEKLWWFHKVTSVLWFIALASFAIHCYDWITADVIVPK